MASSALQVFLSAVTFLLLAIWVLTFRFFDKRVRSEFYALDFCWGALTIGLASGFTLGGMGSELGITERLLVASKTSEAVVLFAGFVFGLGVLALLGSIRILGTGLGLIFALSVAGIPGAALGITGTSFLVPGCAIVCLLVALFASFRAARGQDGPPPRPLNNRRPPPVPTVRRSTKGLTLAALGGIFFGISGPVGLFGAGTEFGTGPYAGLLLFAVGIPIAVIPFTLFLLHATIDLPPAPLSAYWRRTGDSPRGWHKWGLLGGMLWAGGAQAYLCYRLLPAQDYDGHATLIAMAAPIFAAVGALVFLKEAGATRARKQLWMGFGLFAAGILLAAA